MHPLFQNRYVKFVGIGLLVMFALFVIMFIANIFTSSTGLDDGLPMGVTMSDQGFSSEMMERGVNTSPAYYPPQPAPDGYTSGLENYETTQYSVTARTKQFDELCDTLTNLKADTTIHFKSLNQSTNNCYATFYTEEAKAPMVLSTIESFRDAQVTRDTESVTRHRQQIQSQTDILEQQLTSVQNSLTAAETQFDEIADFARANKDAATLSQAINQKLNNIDMLTQRKINLTSQLNDLYQQAADLEERMGVVQFDVSVSRSYPIYPNRESQKWESAWEELKSTFTDTLIGLSTFFAIFVLWAIRISIYLLVLVILARGIWKFAQIIWRKF